MNDEWVTPNWPYIHLDSFYEFELDIAAKPTNSKCKYYLTDSFRQVWPRARSIWCNPPYSAGSLERWLNLCWCKRHEYWRICVLLPVDTSTDWFQRYRKRTKHVLFFNRRISFIGAENTARFASCLFVFSGDQIEREDEVRHLSALGDVWTTELNHFNIK